MDIGALGNIACIAFVLMIAFAVFMNILNVIDFFTGFVSGKRFQSYSERWEVEDDPSFSDNHDDLNDANKIIRDSFNSFHPLHNFYWGDPYDDD